MKKSTFIQLKLVIGSFLKQFFYSLINEIVYLFGCAIEKSAHCVTNFKTQKAYRKKTAIIGSLILVLAISGGFGYRAYYKTTPEYYVDKVNEMLKEALADKTAMQRFKLADTLKFLTQGIHKFPDRLDMRIGKTFLCNSLNQVPCMERGLLNMLERAQINKGHWLWKDGETKDVDFMLNEIQSYQYRFLELQQYNEILRVGQKVIEYYPSHYQSYNSIGAVYGLNNDFDKAYEYTSKALELAPDDPLVRQNMQVLEEKRQEKKRLEEIQQALKNKATSQKKVDSKKKGSRVQKKRPQKRPQKRMKRFKRK